MSIPALTAQIRALCDQIDAEANHPPPEPPSSGRTCYFGYFGDTPTIVAEIKDHADLAWPNGWPSGSTDMQVAKDAKAAGMKIMLPVYGAQYLTDGAAKTQESMEYFFQKHADAGTLDAVVALYPFDEPDVAGLTNAQVVGMVETTRAAAAKFPPIASAPIACFYGPDGKTPGVASFDWIGRDNYGNGPQIMTLAPHQRLMLIPGGCSPWRESPDAFVAYAQSHSEVAAVVPFIWQWPSAQSAVDQSMVRVQRLATQKSSEGYEGIKTNGMAPAYRTAGRTLTGK